MAAAAFVMEHRTLMPTTHNPDTGKIIEAIDKAYARTGEKINDLNSAMVGLRSDVGHLTKGLEELDQKVEKIDSSKAPIEALQVVERRFERDILQIQTQMSQELRRLEASKIGTDQISVDSMDSLIIRMGEAEKISERNAQTITTITASQATSAASITAYQGTVMAWQDRQIASIDELKRVAESNAQSIKAVLLWQAEKGAVIESLNGWRFKVIGGYAAVLAIGALLGWIVTFAVKH